MEDGPQRRMRRRGDHQSRLQLLSLNVGNLSAFLWTELKSYLTSEGLCFDAICLQKVNWSASAEFTVAGWKAIVSASTARADGVMTLIHPKYVSARIKFDEIVKGRALRVQFQAPAGRVELLNIYQFVWNRSR